MMQVLIRFFGKPIRKGVQWYLSKPREFKYNDIAITVRPGVFHPGFFFSTRLILDFINSQTMENENFLELGSGSGIISILACRKGAHVTAIDISKIAVQNTLENSKRNFATLSVIESDLFDNVPSTAFKWIAINPPYYPVDPKTEAEHAWNCGANHEYFWKLFSQLGKFILPDSCVVIILSDVCELNLIFKIAEAHGFLFEKILEKKIWADGQNYLYWIKKL